MPARALDPKAKAKRQKIIAAVGGVILVALLVWRVPQVIALMNKKPPASNATATAPAPTATPALPTPTAGAVVTPGGQAVLVDTDNAPKPEAGQLISFGRFVSKDPFAQQVGGVKQGGASAGTGGGAARPRTQVKVPEPELQPVAPPAPPKASPARSSAQISVDGASFSVTVGATFPTDSPLFKLVSVTKRSAKIAIDGGSYASGATTLTLERGKPVTLVNTADGTRYRVVLVATG
jgi:hypothetical protein